MEVKEIKNEIANKNAIDLRTTDKDIVANRLKAIDILGDVIKNNLKEGIDKDYAIIPKTTKPCLLLPGARKICLLYGLSTEYTMVSQDEKLTKMKCELFSGDRKISDSYGVASIGHNREIGWETNASTKMAQKRALIGAVLGVANLSKVFTQDTEDMEQKPQSNEDTKKRAYELHNLYAQRLNKKPNKFTWLAYISSVQNWSANEKKEQVNPYQLVEKHWDKEYEQWLLDDNGIKITPMELPKNEK